MKKIISRITFVLAAVTLLVSCEADYVMFDSSKNFVAFPSKTTSVSEPGGQVAIPVYVVALEGSPAITVDFDFDATDITNPAVEGVDFSLVNDSKTLSFPQGWGYDTIWIQPIDNNIFEGDKLIKVVLQSNSQNYQFGAISSNAISFLDDEHPLKAWIGTYTVDAPDYWSNFGPETWTVTTAPDPDDLNNLLVTGIGNDPSIAGGYSEVVSVVGAVDVDAKTITFSSGSEIGTHSAYSGPIEMYLGDEDGNIIEGEPIVGDLGDDGSIYVDHIGIKFVGGLNAGLTWGVFETTWTKTGKKAAYIYPAADQVKELKLHR
jgi:hypothetical protein